MVVKNSFFSLCWTGGLQSGRYGPQPRKTPPLLPLQAAILPSDWVPPIEEFEDADDEMVRERNARAKMSAKGCWCFFFNLLLTPQRSAPKRDAIYCTATCFVAANRPRDTTTKRSNVRAGETKKVKASLQSMEIREGGEDTEGIAQVPVDGVVE